MIPLYVKGFFSKGNGQSPGNPLPKLSTRLQGQSISLSNLRQYCDICGFASTDAAPATYPFVLGFPLMMQLMVSPQFPCKVLGLVHLRNQITVYKPLYAGVKFDMQCSLVELRHTEKGQEFDFEMRIEVAGDLYWKGISTILFRKKSRNQAKKAVSEPQPLQHSAYFDAPAGLGLRYAKVSGDMNPIHLYNATAKLLGFPKAIAHGMWAKARCVAQLSNKLPEGPYSIDVQFKLPMFMPASLQLKYDDVQNDAGQDSCQFRLENKRDGKPHLEGSIIAVES